MPDGAKSERFLRRFQNWRGRELAITEEPNISTALSISRYVDDTNFETIQADLVDGSQIYMGFGNLHHSRSYGALLYGKLALEDYYLQRVADNSLAEGERALLDTILANLQGIYEDPSKRLSTKFNEILINTNNWLDHCDPNHANPARRRATFLSIYTMLKFFDLKLNHLTRAEKMTFRLFSVDKDYAMTEIRAILAKTTAKIAELDHILNPHVDVEDTSARPVAPSIEEYIDTLCLDIITQEGRSLHQKMNAVKSLLIGIRTTITELLAEKARGAAVQVQVDHALTILLAISTNEQKVFQKKYALDLINSNRASFDDLIAHATPNEQREWQERLAQLEHPNPTQQSANNREYTLSWLTYIPTVIYRAFAPTSVKKTLNDYSPATLDSEMKLRLRAFAEARLPALHQALVASYAASEGIAADLIGENLAVKQSLTSASKHQLETLLAANHAVCQVLTDYDRLGTLVMRNKEKLREIRGLTIQVDSFITYHHGFFVKLSLYLAKFCLLFKTDAATRIEEAHAMKRVLTTYKTEYEQAVAERMGEITSNPTTSDRIKNAVVAIVSPNEVVVAPRPAPVIVGARRNFIAEYNLVKTMFVEFREAETQDEEQELPMRVIV